MKGMPEIIEALQAKEKSIQERINFLKQHNFKKELEWNILRRDIIKEIRMEIESVNQGLREGSKIDFSYIPE